MSRCTYFAFSLLLSAASACGGDDMPSPADATPDSPAMDTGVPDGSVEDSGPADSTLMDATVMDASRPDAATADATLPDAEVPDATAGGAGSACGTSELAPCAAGFYCDFPTNDCGAAERPGRCAPRPDSCADIYDPVCGCDGTVYSNTCAAASAGEDVNSGGGCMPPRGSFGCGPRFCSLMPPRTEYCQRQISDIADMPHMYSCLPNPVTCSRLPLCMCLERASAPCADMCMITRDGGQIVTCPGG